MPEPFVLREHLRRNDLLKNLAGNVDKQGAQSRMTQQNILESLEEQPFINRVEKAQRKGNIEGFAAA